MKGKDNGSILITGASGSLGREAAAAFARAGWRVYAADRAEPPKPIPGAEYFFCDVTSDESVRRAAGYLESKGSRLDCVLHMAGLYTMDSFIEIPPETLEKMLAVNLMGVYRVNRAVLPLLNKNGRVIITASELALLDPLPFNGIYSMTKRALEAYAHSLALELDLIGVRVVTLCPGAYGDGMTKGALRAMDRMRDSTRLYPEVTERFRRIVMRETGAAKPPEALAKRILRIARKRRPRFKYRMNNSIKLRLFSALPMGAQAFFLRLLLKKRRMK